MDATDQKILSLLQEDATLSIESIASQVHLSSTPCWKRIRRLEKDGVIEKRVALLNPNKVGAGVTVFVAIKTNQHNRDWLDNFATSVEDMPEILDFYRMSGEIDYLLRVVVPDIAAFDSFYQRLINRVPLSDVTSSFAMEQIKHTTSLPILTD
ncbi:MAG: ArsR family transcriptional regulator [Acidiferrobacteraceae bacterium]|jgi:Lrp/AsnC family transcriptional regulator|nr:ArsR family transcriptional regulator [Acidiferrobacteraceae bacterium]|tara:strand:+ start:204 stop:662 length:459 start_codon:yes stop_codon:yes gene_type:complete